MLVLRNVRNQRLEFRFPLLSSFIGQRLCKNTRETCILFSQIQFTLRNTNKLMNEHERECGMMSRHEELANRTIGMAAVFGSQIQSYEFMERESAPYV